MTHDEQRERLRLKIARKLLVAPLVAGDLSLEDLRFAVECEDVKAEGAEKQAAIFRAELERREVQGGGE